MPSPGGSTILILAARASRQALEHVRSGRILDYAAKHYSGKFTRIDVRFHGALCYIDAYVEPDVPSESAPPAGQIRSEWIEGLRNTPIHLCRIRYFGKENRWSFAW
jgi:hypothetical protein